MTYRETAKNALVVQDAVNLSGVVHDFLTVVATIWEEARCLGAGTKWVNRHPIVTIYIDKLNALNGRADFFAAYAEVKKIADDGTNGGVTERRHHGRESTI
jgi:hypothetical protein